MSPTVTYKLKFKEMELPILEMLSNIDNLFKAYEIVDSTIKKAVIDKRKLSQHEVLDLMIIIQRNALIELMERKGIICDVKGINTEEIFKKNVSEKHIKRNMLKYIG